MTTRRFPAVVRPLLFSALLVATAAAQQPPQGRRGRLPPGFPGTATANAPADPLAAPPRPTSAPAVDLSGTWKGAFCWSISVELTDLTLTASPDRRELTGELRFSPIASTARRGVRPDPETVWTIRGRIDPGSNAVYLTPPPAPLTGPMGMAAVQQPLVGVFSASRNEIAGQFRALYAPPSPSAMYFVFVRGGDAKDRADAVARFRSLAEHAAEAAPPAKGSGRGSLPSDADLVQWAAPYEQEYGAMAGAGGVDQISERALTLLEDATFAPLFGETYDRIDFSVLANGMRRFNDPKLARDHGFMQYALYPSPSKLLSVAAMRTIDAWKDERLAAFQKGPPVASAFDDLAATQKAMKETMVYAWPSTMKRLDETIEQIRGTLSGASLTANVDAAIEAAAGLEGARKLATWPLDNAAMLERLSPAERDAAQKKVEAKLDELLRSLLEPSVAQLRKLGAGEEAVRAGADWYRALVAQFDFAAARSPYAEAVARLTSRREPDMSAGSDGILHRIQACKTPEEVDALFASDLSVPGDDGSKAYATLAEAGRKQKQQIEEARILALFSPEEQAIMDRPGHLDLRRAKPRPPKPEEVRLALLRGWAYGTGKVIDVHSCRYVDMTSSGFMAFPFPVILQFSQENLLRADPIGKSGDYECEFTILMQMTATDDNALVNYDEVVRKHSATMMPIVNAFCAGIATESQKKVLRLTENGWVIPELMEAGAIQGALRKMLEGR